MIEVYLKDENVSLFLLSNIFFRMESSSVQKQNTVEETWQDEAS